MDVHAMKFGYTGFRFHTTIPRPPFLPLVIHLPSAEIPISEDAQVLLYF